MPVKRWRTLPLVENRTAGARFRVARNPDQDSRLPFLVYLPIDGGIVLKARDVWPRAARVYCSQAKTPWDESGGLVDEAAVLACKRRGAAIDLVLDRPKLARSQFVFTNARGRPAVWWQRKRRCSWPIPEHEFPAVAERARWLSPLTPAKNTAGGLPAGRS